jgi:hypothetical protein
MRNHEALQRGSGDLLEERVLLRELLRLELRPDEASVDEDLEAPVGERREGKALDLMLELAEQLVRQTDGARLIVSS